MREKEEINSLGIKFPLKNLNSGCGLRKKRRKYYD